MKHKKTIVIVASLFIVVCITFTILLTMVILPSQKLNKAKKLIDSGDYEAAYSILSNLNYKDSEDLRESIKTQYEKALLSKASVGSYVIWGTYEQDNNLENGAEEIEWLVLAKEDNRILVISRYALDCQPYNKTQDPVTWETSSLRIWLNETFLDKAFSEAERALIMNSYFDAAENLKNNTDSGTSTMDQVFLLSITEANKYFSSSGSRSCKATVYCYEQGAYTTEKGQCWWWLRSSGEDPRLAAAVQNSGSIDYMGLAVSTSANLFRGPDLVESINCAVRPALWIDLDAPQ